ncbi:MAG TPA: hypothetical protein VFE71_06745 [Bacteroidales bacterium]|nr:hypothetical protein [Bacteroidales bacterium]
MPTPANDLNITQAGYVVFDGTATFTGRTFQAGSGIVLTNASGVVGNTTIATTTSAIGTWIDEAISFSPVAGNGYFVTATATATLPASPSQGDTIAFDVDGVGSLLTIKANTGQIIRLGKTASAAAGTAVNNFQGDSLTLVYRAADTTWQSISSIGTWSIT